MTGIVVGVDGSAGAAAALRWAAVEAESRHMPLTAVLARGWLDQHRVDADALFDPMYGHERAAEALDSFLRRDLGDAADAARHVVRDPPARALIEAAAGASMLVVGARGLGRFRRLLIGSVS